MADLLTRQIAAAFAAEQRNPATPRTHEDIPRSFEAIGGEWLTDVLCRDVPGAQVVAHRLGQPDDGTNNRRRIHLTYNEAGRAAGLPSSVFCKATQGLANRQMLAHSGGIVCEVTFWNAARALLDIEAPTARLAQYDPVGFNSIVVLDDLGERATFCSETTVVDRGFAEQQVDLLATMHARFHDSAAIATTLGALPTWYDRFHALAGFHLEESCTAGVLTAEDIVPPALFARRDEIWPATLRSLELLRDLPRTLCHGDVHLKNWYVLDGGVVGLGDWGVAHIGHWSRDLCYALATSLSVEDRRAWEPALIARYLSRVEALGVPPVPIDEAMLRYRQSLLTAFAFWTLTLKPTADFPDMQPPATARVFVARLAQAMDDLDVLGSV